MTKTQNHMKHLIRLLTLVLTAGLFSCATPNVHSDVAKGVDFKKFHTFAWLPDADTAHHGSIPNKDAVIKAVHNSVNDEMVKRTYKIDTLKPDLLVLVHTRFETKQQTVQTPVYSSYPYYYTGLYVGPWYSYYYPGYYDMPFVVGYDIHNVNYTEGNLIIDIIERSTRKIVWRGWTTEDYAAPGDFETDIKTKVHQIFRKYPVSIPDAL